MSHPAFVLTAIQCFTTRIGHVVKRTSSYGILIRWSLPSLVVLPPLNINMSPLQFGGLRMDVMSARTDSFQRFVVLNATVNSGTFLTSNNVWTGSVAAHISCCIGVTFDSKTIDVVTLVLVLRAFRLAFVLTS